MSGMLHTSITRMSAIPAFFRGRVRAELDALGVASTADLERLAAQQASSRVPTGAVDADGPATVDLDGIRTELAEMRAAFQRGFQLMASRLETVQTEARRDVESVRADIAALAGEQRIAASKVQDELMGVGRATRRDLERIRTELVEMEAATRRDLEVIAGALDTSMVTSGATPALVSPAPTTPVAIPVTPMAASDAPDGLSPAPAVAPILAPAPSAGPTLRHGVITPVGGTINAARPENSNGRVNGHSAPVWSQAEPLAVVDLVRSESMDAHPASSNLAEIPPRR